MFSLVFVFALWLWIVFYGGAAKLENTLLGYFEFGPAAEKEKYIKIVACAGLCVSVVMFVGDF